MTQKPNVFPQLRFHYGYAFSDDLAFVAGRAVEQDPDDENTAIMAFEYKRLPGQQWSFYLFSPDKVRSMGVIQRGETRVRFLTTSSSQLFYMMQSLEQDTNLLPYKVRTIGDVAFSSGFGSEIHRSISGGAWQLLTPDWHKKYRDFLEYASYNNIYTWPVEIARVGTLLAFDGPTSEDVYFAGKMGGVAHYDGTAVSLLSAFTSENLFGVYARAADDIWICAHAGTLYRGDRKRGFTRFPSTPEFSAVYAMLAYKDQMYISAAAGESEEPQLYVLSGREFRTIQSLGGPRIAQIAAMNIANGVLWAFGVNSVVRYDGKSWEIMDNPYK